MQLRKAPEFWWLYLLNAGGDGGNNQHEGERDHHSVLEVGHLTGRAVSAFAVFFANCETVQSRLVRVTSKRKVMNPTMMRMVCWRNTPRRWYSIFLVGKCF